MTSNIGGMAGDASQSFTMWQQGQNTGFYRLGFCPLISFELYRDILVQ